MLALPIILAAAGCDPGPSGTDDPRPAPKTLTGTTWQIEDIDQAGIVDSSMITLQFPEAGGVAGSTGCNRYFGGASLDGDRLSFTELGSTKRACVPALMDQEQRFLQAMQRIARYHVDDQGILWLLDGSGAQRLKGVRMETDPTQTGGPGSEPQDRASVIAARFDCGSAGTLDVRFLGPETMELTRSGMTTVLQRERSASGARYSGDGVLFWNKGNEATLDVDGERATCTRMD